ncbi:hypothetical protein BU26DRAFT_518702 [Trematosphaeria pertusa]|uniref:F-box domain-containing protein n=1 Tax=Trematosphaeria pertusa TaxID=390896 RepID=A0A6A6IK80_9PLEO|nr:uncharacterized protein BU26DRAFT_518702 [Trematosphaeria pertusa]KAF2250292.1 hypothetical protein BU26DRAFT_518702 [Trematosphaeria pertusa]
MASFATLPTELQEQIIAELDISDLSSFSRTCVCVHNAILPFLYRNVSITWSRCKTVSPTAGLLLRSLLENNSLGPLIHQLHLLAEKVAASPPVTDPYPDAVLDIRSNNDHPIPQALLECNLQKAGIREDEHTEQLSLRKHDAIIALLILNCNNLEWLDVDTGLLVDNTALPRAIEHTFREMGASDYRAYEIEPSKPDVAATATTSCPPPRSILRRVFECLRRNGETSEPNTVRGRPEPRIEQHQTKPYVDYTLNKTRLNGYPSLRRVDMTTTIEDWRLPYYWRLPPRVLVACLHFPALEELHAQYLAPNFTHDSAGSPTVDEGWDEASKSDPELPQAERLLTIRLLATSINAKGLTRILSLTPSLTRLVYDYYAQGHERCPGRVEWFRYGTLRGSDLRHALESVRGTLQYLTVSLTPVKNGKDPLDLFPYTWLGDGVGSLKDFHSLRGLGIALPVLCGDAQRGLPPPPLASMLPARLEEFHLTGDVQVWGLFYQYGGGEILELIEQFVAVSQEVTPHMKRLKLDVHAMDYPEYIWEKGYSERAKKLCTETGLVCEITE